MDYILSEIDGIIHSSDTESPKSEDVSNLQKDLKILNKIEKILIT